MPHPALNRRTLVALALAAGAVAAVPAASATAGEDCLTLTKLTEKVLDAHYNDVPPTGYSPGDTGSWHNQLIDRKGNVVADVNGTSRVLYAKGDVLWTVMENTDTLNDGSLVWSTGLVNTTALLNAEWVSLEAIGTEGAQGGKLGKRSFKRTTVDRVYDAKLRVC